MDTTKNKDTQFPFLIIALLALAIIFGTGRIYYLYNHGPAGKSFEVCHTVGFFRDDLEEIISKKIIWYSTLTEASREAAGKEIDEIFKVLDYPDNLDIIVYFYSPNGEAKSFSDPTVSVVVVKSATGWELAKINLLEGK